MNGRVVRSNVAVYSAAHALVDATCAAVLFAIATLGQVDPRALFLFIVLYNVLAFSTQPLFGLAVDSLGMPQYAAISGMVLVAASTLLLQLPFWATLVAGVGNALFHVGGGVVSLKVAAGRAALPGIYVAPGALGLLIGTLVGGSGHFAAWPFIALLVAAALLILRARRPPAVAPRELPEDLRWFETVIVLLLVSVAIRGLVGLSLVLPWKSNPTLLLALTGAVVLGKALGGVLGDRFGWARVALSGLALSVPLLTLFAHVPALAIAGAFFFNLSMPITLICLAEMLPGKEGFAFGLTTLALIVGAWPTFTSLRALTGRQIFIVVTTLASIAALYAGLRLYAEHFDNAAIREYD